MGIIEAWDLQRGYALPACATQPGQGPQFTGGNVKRVFGASVTFLTSQKDIIYEAGLALDEGARRTQAVQSTKVQIRRFVDYFACAVIDRVERRTHVHEFACLLVEH